MPSHRPATSDHLRVFLRDHLTQAQIRRIASADYDFDGDEIADEFRRYLNTGSHQYAGRGNLYECALMQRHDMTEQRPMNEIFGAWWLGAFCSEPHCLTLIHNLGSDGVASLLHMLVRGCAELREGSSQAAHAALPFVDFLRLRLEPSDASVFDLAIAALEAIERYGPEGARSGRYQAFMERVGDA